MSAEAERLRIQAAIVELISLGWPAVDPAVNGEPGALCHSRTVAR